MNPHLACGQNRILAVKLPIWLENAYKTSFRVVTQVPDIK